MKVFFTYWRQRKVVYLSKAERGENAKKKAYSDALTSGDLSPDHASIVSEQAAKLSRRTMQ